MSQLFYIPQKAAVGDVIPFYAEGEFKIFYLNLGRSPENPGALPDWYLLGTQDFVHYKDYGPSGIQGGTGTILKVDDVYHMFSCIFPDNRQIICHATSRDLLTWEKHPEDDFEADPAVYEPGDWRDPFVFWNADASQYWMLMAARERSPLGRSGCVGLCVSADLKKWEARPPFFSPYLNISALECPDLFQIGDWWYLIYSTYTDRFVTHYRMSRSMCGPWLAPAEDTFDGRAFYAAKTISDGKKRYVLGWNPTRTENHYDWNPPGFEGMDFNTWDWGGNLVVHELWQADDGTLKVRIPKSLAGLFECEQPVELRPVLGEWKKTDSFYTASSPSGFACGTMGSLPACCLISAQYRFKANTRRLGLMLRASRKLDQGYSIQIEPDRDRVVFKSYPFPNEHGGKVLPYEVELERPLELSPDQTYSLQLVIDESIGELYLNDQIAMSMRLYDLREGDLVFFVADGEASFENISIRTIDSQ
jgi:beta-fructofuranosidase